MHCSRRSGAYLFSLGSNFSHHSSSFGLEQNEYSGQQKLIVNMKLLGELYNYSLIDHPLIFDTLYNILGPINGPREGKNIFTEKQPNTVLSFLINGNSESTPEKALEIDPPTDLFRIRLVRAQITLAWHYLLNHVTDVFRSAVFWTLVANTFHVVLQKTD